MSDREKSKFGAKNHEATSFDFSQPRPPALGEEKTSCVVEWPPHYQMDRAKNLLKSSPSTLKTQYDIEDSFRMGSGPPSRHDKPPQNSPPVCLSWAQSLHNLLKDPDGSELFLKYLRSEGPQHADALDFWFACEGLKKHNELEIIQRLVKLIYKTYCMKAALPIKDELRREITRNLKTSQCLGPPVTLFDEAQAQVENLINTTTYPNFLKSDMYLQYLQSIQNLSSCSEDFSSESSSSSSSVSNKDVASVATNAGPLPTLHEDMEFMTNPVPLLTNTPGTASASTGYHTPTVCGPIRLTKNMLLRSQNYRALDIRPKSETYAGLFISYRGVGAHAAYNSYNPVSRQDSEMQSLSSHSDARTESDNLSLADSAVDSRMSGRSRHKTSTDVKHTREMAALNKETDLQQTLIPRTQRLDISKCIPMDLEQHAAILKEKLEGVKRQLDTQELLDKKLKESDSLNSLEDKGRSEVQSRELENAIREKLYFQDEHDQDILDQHVSRVFSDHPLAISPGLMSPGPHSPHKNKWLRSRRKEKDVFSTFSGDSGNVHDFAEGSEHRLSMVKSKSIPEYSEERFSRNASCRRSSSKKSLTGLTDSGVSVVSDTASVGLGPQGQLKESRVIHWLLESDKSGRGVPNTSGHAYSEMAVRDGNVAKKYGRKGHGSRSNSLERNSVTGSLGPAQPFVADPSMPPPPLPNTSIQLEEARRRLMEDERARSRQRPSNKYDLSQSSQSTLKKATKAQKPTSIQYATAAAVAAAAATTSEDLTILVAWFCDEQVPYLFKVPGSQITLRQFKEYLPKKGNYRYFFKTVCEDLGNQVTHEEVTNDSEVLPLWEGKIMAQVKPID